MKLRLALLALFAIGFVSAAQACTTITATTITTNTTWGMPADSCYLIQNSITISNGATLTIQPGTVLYFASGTSLIVGGTSTSGMLSAVGTANQPVVFTSQNALHGGWAGLDFRDYSDYSGATSFLSNCVIKKGGTTGASGAQIKVTSSNGIVLSNCVIADHRNLGLDLTNSRATLTSCTFRDSIGTYPVSGSARDVQSLFGSNTFIPHANGTYNAIVLKAGSTTESSSLSAPPWPFCYLLASGEFVIEGSASPVLTFARGTVVKMPAGDRIATGINSAGGLVARGVVFTSTLDDTLGDTPNDGGTAGAAGQWRGLYLDGSTLDALTVLDSCVVRYAGEYWNDGIRITNCEPTVTHCLIEKNTGNGINVSGNVVTALKVHDNVLRDNTTFELFAPPVAMANLAASNTVVASADHRYNGYLLQAGSVPLSCSLPKPQAGFCYILESGEFVIEAAAAPVLTIAPGSMVKVPAGGRIATGINSSGGLVARGVVFTSTLDDTLDDTAGDGATTASPGSWRCLFLDNYTLDASTVIDSCVVRFGGEYWNCGVRVANCEPTVTRCLIERNTFNGLNVVGNTVTATKIHGNILRENGTHEILATPSAMANLVLTNSVALSANGRYNGYVLHSGSIPVSCSLPCPPVGFAYQLEAGEFVVENAAAPVLTIAPGSVVKVPAGDRIAVGINSAGALDARGVVFTSTMDDAVGGGDTAGDGPTTGAPGQWRGIDFEGYTVDLRTVLACCTVRYAGEFFSDGVRIVNCSPRIVSSTIESNLGDGVYVSGAVSIPSLYGCTITANTDWGVEVVSNGAPVLRHDNLAGNGAGAVRTATTALVDALWCWWGDATGPLDASAGGPDQNAGLGAAVSDNVGYRPWRTGAYVTDCAPVASTPVVPPPARVEFALYGARPNPSRGPARIAFALPDGEVARLEVFDIGGRRVSSRLLTGMGPGYRELPLADGVRLAPGVYQVRLQHGGRSLSARAIVLN